MPKLKLTKTNIDRVAKPGGKTDTLYWDTNGFGLRVKAPPAPPAQPSAQRQAGISQGGSRAKPPRTRAANGAGKGGAFGFSEPSFEAWLFDGCKRREPVVDQDEVPPRVIRQVGWRVCMTCSTPFWSTDVIKVRMCENCKLPPPPGHRGRNGRKRST